MRAVPFLKFLVALLLFWGWNTAFGTFSLMSMYLLFGAGIPLDFTLALALVAAVPLISMVLAIRNLRDPEWQLRWLFGVEAPLVLLAVLRIGLVREMTVAGSVWFLMLGLGLGFYTIHLRRGLAASTGIALVQTAGAGVLAVVGGAVAIMLGLVLVPTTSGILEAVVSIPSEVLRNVALQDLRLFPMMVATLGLFSVTGINLVLMPVSAAVLYVGASMRLLREATGRFALGAPLVAMLGAGGVVGTLAWADGQKEHLYVPEFVDPSGDSERLVLMEAEERIRRALVDQSLASYRYLGGTDDSDFVQVLWRKEFGVESSWPQDTFNLLIHPLLYEGTLNRSEAEKARAFYGQLFDQPFDKAEREAFRVSMNATWDRSSAKAGLSDIDKKTVHLEKQSLSWVEQNSLAVVTLDEVYANTSDMVQEVHLSFTMPESAAFTGLWLSDDAAQPEKFPAVLAPRGAAQATYDRIRERGSDPAILEQVGPRQYRLRVFPIPVQRGGEYPRMYLRMRWNTLADAVGIPAPQLLEVRNLYWDASTLREVQGRASNETLWLPPRVGVVGQLRSHATLLPDGRVLRATPAEAQDVSSLVKPARYAVLVDGTRSMRTLGGRVQKELAWLRSEIAPGATVEVYVASGWGGRPFRKVGLDWQPEDLDFFGGAMPTQALESLSKEGSWDTVIFLTDNGSYDVFETVIQTQREADHWREEVSTASPDIPLPTSLPASLWLVHLGGELPQGYPDPLADRLNSTGGIGTSVEDVFQRILVPGQDRVDGYVWTVEEAAPLSTPERDLDAMAVRRLLNWEVRSAGTVADYDHIHQLAKGAHVVTPWSSMLVLVEDWQRKLLEEQEAKEDRFDRETDGGAEFKTAPGSPLVSAVPEPEEWLLLALGSGILGFWYWKRRGEQRGVVVG